MWGRLDACLGKDGKEKEGEHAVRVRELLLEVCDAEEFSRVILGVYGWMAHSPLFVCTDADYVELHVIKEQASELHLKALEFVCKK